jgi:phospholipid/cholesterol/gamma-HCH transport system permease protein
MEQTGVNAIPIVALLSFLIGMVLSYMAATQLAGFGAQIFVVNLLEVAIMREMGVLLTAILVAGRSGSSYTAQIGAMAANQEIDAMRSIGLDPMHMLVVPRVTALVATLPRLVMVADVSGLLGGLVAVWVSLDITPGMFMEALQRAFNLQHFVIGLAKAPFFAAIIGCIGCFDGFKARRSADSVGRMTTRSVVESIFMVIALDAFFAVFLTSVGI